ncbi:uncharacterized protein LOC113773084 [Coffea eugenioides]|uniref:uncharacterized protein LOC113773084 n=1 Tax=Coffea eugenioides TaxID=49369 RepID=UPI000F60EEB8|nr:uncharacterized protein LOC113773084 [Coffea eugenioides]
MLRCSKSLIFRNPQVEQLHLWPRRRNGINLLHGTRRPTQLPLLLHPNTLPLHLHSLPIRYFIPIPSPPLCPLLRPRTHSLSSPMSSLATPPPESNSNPPTKTERVAIKGRVQGVFYRDWTVQNATELGLKGWVRNRRDGSVEALFSGPPEKVQEMEQRCRRGPPAAAVTGFRTFPCTDDPGTGFERRPTV